MARTQGLGALLQRHYDKIIALAALAALLGSVLQLIIGGARTREEETLYDQRLDGLTPRYPKAAPVDLGVYSNALVQLQRPFRIAPDPEQPDGFFMPEARVWCASCRLPIPRSAKTCPVCGVGQPGEPTEDDDYDGDGGGIPDKVERKYGFNVSDPKDDTADSDGDGFDNLTEVKAGTSPVDDKDHPDFAGLLRVKSLVATQLPLKFMGAIKLPGGRVRCQINLTPPGTSVPDTYFVVEGESIGKTDFRLVKYIETVERRPDPMMGGRERDFTIQKVVLARGKKEITLPLLQDAVDTDFQITLVLTLDGSTYDLTADSVFALRDETYRVIGVDSKASSVVIRNDSNGRELTVPKL